VLHFQVRPHDLHLLRQRHENLVRLQKVAEDVGQIEHHAAQEIFVANKRDISRGGDLNAHAAFPREARQGIAAFVHNLVQIQRNRPKRISAGVRPSEHQHVFENAADVLRLRAHQNQGVAIFTFVPMVAIERHIRHGAHDRHRRPQFVRRVGHELTLCPKRRA